MKLKSHILLLLVIFSIGCQKKADDQSINNSDNSADVTGKVSPPMDQAEGTQKAVENAETLDVEILSFEAKNLPDDFKYEDKISGGAKWIDANGENTLIVSGKTVKGSDFSTQKIFGYLYAVKDGQTKLLWKIQDSEENPCDLGKGLTSPVEVRDIDGDGVAENMFVYNIAGGCDVSPIPYKLMMHSGEKKLAVRGFNAVDISGYKQKSEKNFDEAFKSSPKEFRGAASEFWDKYVRPLK